MLEDEAENCPIPCNPTWSTSNVNTVCGTGRVCCQTIELRPKDCVQEENGTWRAAFLSGSMELRGAAFGTPTSPAAADILAQLTPELFFDAVAVQVDGPRAWDLHVATRWTFPDADGATYRVTLKNGVLTHVRDGKGDVALTVTVPKAALGPLATSNVEAALGAGLVLDGDASVLQSVLGVLDAGDPGFNIVTP